jgi:hypothetical protein
LIVLNEDGKSFVQISSWEDVATRPGFQTPINKDQIKLKAIIGKYRLEPIHACGISSCRTKHGKGYLVVCENGVETNIGHDCGREIFGVEFTTLENIFNRETNAQRYREVIKEALNKIDTYSNKIINLKESDKSGYWCYQQIHWYMNSGFENQTLKALKQKAKAKENRIYRLRRLDDRELEIAKEIGNFETHEKIQIATISGIAAIKNYKKLKKILDVHLGQELESFKVIEPDQLEFADLKHWHNWINRLEKRIIECNEIIDDCLRFLSQSNITTIRKYKTHLLN